MESVLGNASFGFWNYPRARKVFILRSKCHLQCRSYRGGKKKKTTRKPNLSLRYQTEPHTPCSTPSNTLRSQSGSVSLGSHQPGSPEMNSEPLRAMEQTQHIQALRGAQIKAPVLDPEASLDRQRAARPGHPGMLLLPRQRGCGAWPACGASDAGIITGTWF